MSTQKDPATKKNVGVKAGEIDPETGQKRRINTSKMLNNEGFYGSNGRTNAEIMELGDEWNEEVYDFITAQDRPREIRVSPYVADQYDEATCDDPILLRERKDAQEQLYEIYRKSPFFNEFRTQDGLIKIPKERINATFYYLRDHLLRKKKLSSFEVTIAIATFLDLNYDYLVHHVLNSKMMSEILNDFYENGMAKRIEEEAEDMLF